MPRDSATWDTGWSQQDQLLALIAETMDHWGRHQFWLSQFGRLKTPDKKAPDPFIRIEHPGRPKPSVVRPATTRDMSQIIKAIKL